MNEPLYDEICFELTNYEHETDPETTPEEWADVFYFLLCKVQNAIDTRMLVFCEKYDKEKHSFATSCSSQTTDEKRKGIHAT